MAKRDYYEVLGLQKGASKDDIKSAYRKLAKKYHPDNKETGDENKFKEIQEAYDILYDDNKRATYDQFGHAAFDNTGGASPNNSNPFNGGGSSYGGGFGGFGDEGVDLGDIFSSFFGGGNKRQSYGRDRGPQRGADSFFRVKIDFIEAVQGKDVELAFDYNDVCPHCKGSGADTPSDVRTCNNCRGRGYVTRLSRTLFATFENQVTCPDCGGKGKIVTKRCSVCGGSGNVKNKKNITVHIPAGINDGQQVRLQNLGEAGVNGGEHGDLYVEVNVKPHPYFKREGNDIHLTIPVDFIDAIVGKKITVPTVYGNEEVNIPSGSQMGAIIKLRGKGINDLRSGRPGDEIIHLDIKIPTSLNKNQRKALEDYLSSSDDSSYDKWLKKFRA